MGVVSVCAVALVPGRCSAGDGWQGGLVCGRMASLHPPGVFPERRRHSPAVGPFASVLDLTNDLAPELSLDQVHSGDFGLAG